DVGVGVVAVDAPGLEDAVYGALVAGPPHVVHHLVPPALAKRGADPAPDLLQHLVPAHAPPPALAAPAVPPQRVEDALGVVDLVDRGRPLRAVASARGGMERVALELADAHRVLVDVGEQAAGRLAVEADRGHEHVALLDAPRPLLRVVLAPVVPFLRRREG